MTTVQHLHRWQAANASIRAGMYLCPAIPTAIVMAVNGEQWFGPQSRNGWSIGVGFAMLLTAFLSSILTVSNKDKVLKDKTSEFLFLGILFCVIGVGIVMLASILTELGWYFVYMGIALFGSMGCAIASDKWSGQWVEFYKQVCEENGLTSPADKRKKARRQAAEEEAKRERADLL